jgi:two-component system, OmpR family, sensor kinase
MLGQIEGAFAQREASERRMRRFLADASHELRTPLTSIRGYAEVFQMGAVEDREDLEKAMRRIEQESTRMSAMVNDLLTLARLDEVREPVRKPVDLRQLVAEACDDARAASPDRRIELTAPEPVELLGDPDQLRQVIANLLSNATVHTPAGTAIEVGLARRGGEAVVSVRDHGPGLADSSASQVFERFWRESSARGRDTGGAGLGLAIVAGVVAAHGGRAGAANHPNGGAVFTVELPLRVAAPTA